VIKKSCDLKVTVTQNMRGGEGNIIIRNLADKAEMHDKARLFAQITIKPRCSIGFHTHENESETYFMLSGKALYDDNGTQSELSPGDVTITSPGQGHSIANQGDEDVELIALIVLE
jgi:mannose-6-phosphate isomerase-like protein (cupin superfamily)